MDTRTTPALIIGTRIGFATAFLFIFLVAFYHLIPRSELSLSWLFYLFVLYIIAERFYYVFKERGVDLTFAYPLMLVMYTLNIVSMSFEAQERFPLLNRVEHFVSFLFLAYIAWVFFNQYLPQSVWRDHPYYTALLVFSITAAAGVINEIVELSLDGLFKTRFIGMDRLDTSLDLLMNTLGSGIFLAVQLVLRAPTKTS